MQFKTSGRLTEETLLRKSKQLESVLKEKKCQNCILCIEDIQGRGETGSSNRNIVSELNERLIKNAQRINELEENVRHSALLISHLSQQVFAVGQQKLADQAVSEDRLRQIYELKLMEVEDTLSLETAKCAEIIKARVAPLEDKIDRMKRNEEKLRQETTDLESKVRELTA